MRTAILWPDWNRPLAAISWFASLWLTSLGYCQDPISFNRDVRPILADKCFACHGLDEKKREAGLRLDTFDAATADNDGTRAIVPGDLEASEFWTRITSEDESERMPPVESHKELSPAERAILKRWILAGAPYQKHWSFEPVANPPVPGLAASGRNPVDGFIGEALARVGLQLAPEADRPTLIRRVAFTLTGLPPKPSEVDEFLRDSSPDAYERMVERYLGSVHYGEEMARHWLDIARYADTHGLHLDNERQMWAYRDWVVKSFNRNQPFSDFTVEQLAGDLLPNPTTDQLVATGFNRCNVTTSEGGSIDAEFQYRYAVDRTSTAVQTWMGLTAGCAVCHDHKFDPLTAREFYSLYAFFNSAADPAMDGNALLTQPVLKLESDADKQKLAEFDQKLADLQNQLNAEVAALNYQDPADANPAPAASSQETVWLEDDFPAGGQVVSGPGQGTVFVSLDQSEQVYSGQRSLKRTDAGLSQDVWQQAATPLVVPANATIFAYVYLEPSNLPQAVMLQFHKGGWLHRAVWGNYEVIPWGAPNTTEKVSMGSLPEAARWVRLEVPAAKLGLNAGDQLTGFATTQFGGTVYWDKLGVLGVVDPARDPQYSWTAWWNAAKGKDTPGLPGDLNAVAKAGPDSNPDVAQRDRLKNYFLGHICLETRPKLEATLSEIKKAQEQRELFSNGIPSTFVYRDTDQPRESFVMLRGQYDKPGEKVEPGVPAILPGLKDLAGRRPSRLDFAQWLMSPEHPLTARVAVNRFWQQVFGIGLVKSSGDFGTQGELPSHPELLDWLAVRFRETNWDVKDLMRMFLCSATFRQDSRVDADLLERDPENRLLGRGPRLRLDAEQIRDNALFTSGLIDLTVGGKGVKPYQPPNIWEPVGFVGSNTRFYQQDSGSALYRRSLYTFYKRTAPPPFMVNFDAPNREQTCTRRERSNTPLQALQLMNDVQHLEAARALAARVIREGGVDEANRIKFLFQVVVSREPTVEEAGILQRQLAAHRDRYRQDTGAAGKVVMQGASKPDDAIPADELAAYTLVASTVLNLDETLTRN